MEGFSAIWGRFDNDDNFCLGARWNGGEDERGYPGQGAYPLWFVIPDYLALSMLERLNTNALQDDLRAENGEPCSIRINKAIRVFMNQSDS